MIYEKRNYNDPKYKQWRTKVYRRDKYKCKKCGSKYKINAHHIKKWAIYPELRFDINNGITLCKNCHKEVWAKEEQYESYFLSLLEQNTSDIFIELQRRLLLARK